MCKRLIFLTSVVLVLALAGTNVALGEVFETVIADGTNDTEEDLNPSKLGEADRGSSDLEFPYEDEEPVEPFHSDPQLVGLRFQVDIPAGKLITNAWVRFKCDKDDKLPAAALPVNVIIEGELSPDAPEFHDDAPAVFDLSSRPTTTAKVKWSVPVWVKGDQGPDQTSSNIASIIQEIIDLPGWASGNSLVLIIRDDPDNPSEGLREAEDANPPDGDESALLHVEFEEAAAGVTIPVEAGGDITAANALAVAGDTIDIAAGTFALAGQIELKDGVTYQGAGPELTIIDGGGVTRAFAAWGDLGATNGQVDANGVGVPNLTGPTGWVLDGMTIQNCVADAAGRQDILSAARDLLNNYTGTPYTLAAAQAENGGVTDNPGWFDILSGGADDNLTDVELQAYLDNNLPGSAGHLVANDGMNTGGGGLILRNGAAGTVQNCSFLNNQAPLNSGDGGAVNTSGSGVALTIDNCEFIGNSCDDGGGALRMSSASACTITGTIFTENQAVIGSGDGGAIMTANPGTTLTIDNCEFNGNSCIDGGGALRLGAAGSTCTITASTFTGNYIVEGSGDGGAIRVTGDDSTYVLTDCSFIGNTAADDGAAVRYGPDRAELTMTNCSFIGNGKAADGTVVGDDGVWSCNDDDAGPVTIQNCLFADNACNDDRLVELKAVFSVLNCTFIGNVAGDKALIAVRGRDWDSTGDGTDDVTTDDSIIANCLFINNTMLSDSNVIGDTRNDVFAPTVINCLFFGNLDGTNPANNTDNNSPEVGTIDVSAVTDATQIVVDPAGDYHLVAGSPAIDASDPATATATDIEGTAAVGVRDVGAYEAVVN